MEARAEFGATGDYFRSARAALGELYRVGVGPFARQFRQTPTNGHSQPVGVELAVGRATVIRKLLRYVPKASTAWP